MGNKILLVDDSPLFLRQAKSMLEANYEVYVAPSGEKALVMMDRLKPDLFILDYEMPVMDGRELLMQIRNKPAFCITPVIFLTAVADREHIKKVLELKPEGYILKPVAKDELNRRVDEVINMYSF